ncbi:serine carboxypeptidase-like 12 [Trifolium pratense]|nr:serine carboxypeptidase-like 12 [Trifolium pratense]
MATLSSYYNGNNTTMLIFAFLVIVLQSTHIVFATSESNIVKFLPGFEGPLPFVLETGYIEVSETERDENAEVFYYFIESENNPKQDPLLLWLTGGPGCSGFSGLVFEIGPLAFKNEVYNGSLPNLFLRQHSWTKVSNIIFLDLPAGTGFSYPKTETAVQQSTWKLVQNAHQFLRKWLIDHPKFLSNEVYIAGDSYSGIPVPIIVQEISYENEGGLQPRINLQGYILGNPITTPKDDNYQIPFNHAHALISDELYQSLQKNCKGEYTNIDPQNALCLRVFQSYKETISGVSGIHILEPKCESDFHTVSSRRLIDKARDIFSSSLTMTPLYCRTDAYFLSPYWANDDNVRKALHIRKGSIGKWKRCNNDLPFKHETLNSFPYHANLSKKGFRSLIYSGDHDMRVPFLATQAWIRSLNYSIVDDWRPWYSNDQVAGYTRTYSNRMTFATVKGGGHTAPEYKPEECLGMLTRWLSNNPL